ncbi:unnamed protein product, partial [Mesorhabditis belari]|uniref:SH3 domain-containing protein n=1 Tax=Mesorhabditis belari TaxID=2138241 RepID=A0AAF3J322_9BILA
MLTFDLKLELGKTREFLVLDDWHPDNETQLELRKNDIILTIEPAEGNKFNGFGLGTNQRTRKFGLYPNYLVREKWRTFNFSVFN